jgi:hypothetical protein
MSLQIETQKFQFNDDVTFTKSVSSPSISAVKFYGQVGTFTKSLSSPSISAVNLYVSGTFSAGIFAGGTQITTTGNTTYTFQLSDNGTTIASTNSTGGLTATVVGTSYPIGFQVGVLQLSSSRIAVSGQNITINQSNGFYKTTKQYSAATLLYTGTTGWVLFGDLAS